MTNQGIYMTATGRQRAIEALARKTEEYEAICRERSIAHELSGDGWHDNPHFNRLQQLEADKSREIAVLKGAIGSARLVAVDPANRPMEAVRLGSLVRVVSTNISNGEQLSAVWEIVGYDETDTANSQLAYNSPLGSALIGKEEGEEVEVALASGKTKVYVDALLEGQIA